jgi:hypothetical protein
LIIQIGVFSFAAIAWSSLGSEFDYGAERRGGAAPTGGAQAMRDGGSSEDAKRRAAADIGMESAYFLLIAELRIPMKTGDAMKIARFLLLLSVAAAPVGARANDFPTTDRVEYVLECMKNHSGKYEYLYKCSCVIDQIAKALRYEEYVETSTALRDQTLSGPRGAAFRDPDSVKAMAKKYKAIQAGANKACNVQ